MNTITRFVSYSLIIHLIAVSFLFVFPLKKEHKREPFFARLISPEDIGIKDSGTMTSPVIPSPKSVPMHPEISKAAPHSKSLEKPSYLPLPNKGISKDVMPSAPLEGIEQPSQPGSDMGELPPSVAVPQKRYFSVGESAKEAGRELAQRKEEKQEKSTVTFDAKEFKYYGYMQRLKEKIEGIWEYPPAAAEKGIYGDLYIDFTIRKDGTLGSVELVRTSGQRDLDDAAMQALREAAPYWPLPEEWKKEGLTITGHFIYTLYGSYIR